MRAQPGKYGHVVFQAETRNPGRQCGQCSWNGSVRRNTLRPRHVFFVTGIVAGMVFPTFVADHGCVASPPNMMIHMALKRTLLPVNLR